VGVETSRCRSWELELLVVDIGWMDGLRLEEGSGEGFCQKRLGIVPIGGIGTKVACRL
jgi:hypothetical protein